MRVLLLRPEPQAGLMAAELQSHGIATIVAPMLTIVPAEGVGTHVAAEKPAVLIFTSANAVSATDGPGADAFRSVPAVAVGPATARAARAAGFTDVREADGDAAAVADLVVGTFPPILGPVVHVAGRDRAGDIAGALSAVGFSVRVIEAYRAEMADTLPADVEQALKDGDVDAVVVASARTAEAFRRCLEAAALTLQPGGPVLVAISPAAAAPLQPDFGRIVLAERPTGEDLTKAVVALAASLDLNARGRDAEPSASGGEETEEATDMAAGSDRRGSGPYDRSGRRKGKPTTIDLTATEVPRSEEAAATGEADPGKGAEPAETAGFTVPPDQQPATAGEPHPERTEADATTAEAPETAPAKPDDPDQIFVSDVLSGSEEPAAAAAERGPDEDASTRPEAAPADAASQDPSGSPADGRAAPVEPPPRVAAATYPPQRDSGGALRLVAAAVVGGVIALGGGAALLAGGFVPGSQETESGIADLRSELATLSQDLQAIRSAPSAPAADPVLSERIAAVESALQGIPEAPADQAPAVEELRTALGALTSRLDELEARPAPADPAERLEALAGELQAVRGDLDAIRSGQQAAAEVLQQQQAAVEEQRTALDQQRTAVDELAARPLPPSVEPARVDRLEQTLSQSLAGLSERIGGLDRALTERVAGLETSVSETRESSQAALEEVRSSVSDLSSRVEGIPGTVDALAGRVGTIEERLADAPAEGEIAALSLAVTTLTSKVDSGEPFAADLQVLKTTSPNLPDLTALEATAESGVATQEALTASFPVADITAARPASTETGLLDRVMIGAKSLVNYRETGESATDSLSVPLDEVTRALDAGNLPAAAAAWDRLPDFAKERSADWKARLDQKIAADAAVDALTTTLLDRLQAAAGAPSTPPAN